jgi:hypothetical protein
MKKNIKLPVLIVAASLFICFFTVRLAMAATTNSNNGAPAKTVAIGAIDFLVMDFNINVGADSRVAGISSVSAAGKVITSVKPWSTMKFYDNGNVIWESGSDWIGLDDDADGKYTGQPDTAIECDGSATSGRGLDNCELGAPDVGDPLVSIDSNDHICLDSLTNPTCVYYDGGGGCGNANYYIVGSACANVSFHHSGDGDPWVYDDVDDGHQNGTYDDGENIYLEYGYPLNTYNNAAPDTTIVGTAPVAGSVIVADSPWATMKFYDNGNTTWDVGADFIGLDADANNYYLDKLTALTADLTDAATINALTDTTNVKFWLDGGTAGFGGGDIQLGTTATTVSAYDSGGSGWYVSGLSQELAAGANRIFVTMTLNDFSGFYASNNEIIKMSVPQYVDDGSDKTWQLGDRGMFLASRVLGNVVNTSAMTVDAIRPELDSASFADDALNIADEAAGTTVTFTFSEPVTGFTSGDLTFPNGTITEPVVSIGSAAVWTATFTPDDDVEDYDNVLIIDMAGINDVHEGVVGNAGIGTENSDNYGVDTREPTVGITDDELGVANIDGGDVVYTFTFLEDVTGFTDEDVTLTEGTKGTFASVTAREYTLVVTPTPNFEGNMTVDVAAGAALDGYSNGSLVATQSVQQVDTKAPTVEITDDESGVANIDGGNVKYTFDFSENVTGFAIDDVVVTGGTEGILTTVTAKQYTLEVTPDSDSITDITVDVAAGVAHDLNGNDSVVATQSVQEVDTTAPTVEISSDQDGIANIPGGNIIYTFDFSEDVTGFTDEDITLAGGTKGAFASVNAQEYTLVVIPTPNSTTDITVDVGVGVAHDLHSNDNLAADQSVQTVDTLPPTVEVAMDDSAFYLGQETTTVTFTFSEVPSEFTAEDVSVVSGAIEDIHSTIDPLVKIALFTATPGVDHDNANVITVGTDGWTDPNGNHPALSTDSDNYTVDTKRPTLDIEIDDTIKFGETPTVTFTFSEEVTGFSIDDVTVHENGELSDFSTDDDIVWTATFTPTVGVEDDSNVISVDMTQLTDLATNAGAGTTNSNNYAIDVVLPTFDIRYYSDSGLTLPIEDDSKLKVGTYYLKIHASEALGSTPTVTLVAEGSANDVTNGATTYVSGNDYKYTRTIASDALAVGTVKEEIKVTGTDSSGNASTNVDPTNEATRALWIDTVAPAVNAGVDAGTVTSQFTQDATVTDAGGIASYLWSKESGQDSVTFGTATAVDTTVSVPGGGPYVIRLTVIDLAGNSAYDEAAFTWGTVHGGGGGGYSAPKTKTITEPVVKTFEFVDVPKATNKNSTAIYDLYQRGIINGYSGNQFKPENTINRAEITKILVIGSGATPTLEMYKNCFPDVKEQWFAPYVCYAKERKLLKGYDDGLFKPAKEITKSEYFKILMNALGYGSSASVSTDPFGDVKKTSWYAGFVDRAKGLGIISATERFFSPDSLMKRGTSVEYLYRVLILKK